MFKKGIKETNNLAAIGAFRLLTQLVKYTPV